MPDELTHLPDRHDFTRELVKQIVESRKAGFTLALAAIKVLHLHDINNTFGYKAGDALLAETAFRIKSMLRQGDVLYRIGGNSFALVLPTLREENFARLAINKLLALLEEPFDANGHLLKANIKIGVALSPEHTADAEQLSQYADSALEQAVYGTEAFKFFDPAHSMDKTHSLIIEQDLHSAIDNDELMMFYQPQLELQNQTLCGMEALIRWNSPSHGFVPPDLFIPLAEKSELILPLTLWTFNTAMRQAKWLQDNGICITVSINLSASVLYQPNLVEHITAAMNIWGIVPEMLVLEVTESAFMRDPEQGLCSLQKFHEIGIQISIDDFGTGYSSMAYLSRLPLNELKIDKSFVANMMNNRDDLKIVRSVIDLAHNFDLTVVAEGIEDEETLTGLIDLGCDHGQGYYFGRPMPAEEFLEWSNEK